MLPLDHRRSQTGCLFLSVCNFGSPACLCAPRVCADEPPMQLQLSCDGLGRSAGRVLLGFLYLLLPLHSLVCGQRGLLSHNLTVSTLFILVISRMIFSWGIWFSSSNLWEAGRLEPAILLTVHPPPRYSRQWRNCNTENNLNSSTPNSAKQMKVFDQALELFFIQVESSQLWDKPQVQFSSKLMSPICRETTD